MSTVVVEGAENIRKPAFYIPNRLSIASGRELYHLLDRKVCFHVATHFPPAPDIMAYLESKKVHIEYFDFRHTTPRRVREQIWEQMEAGNSVIFLPGTIARTKNALADLPSPFLRELARLHISPIPIFLSRCGEELGQLCTEDEEAEEHLCILPKLKPGVLTGERLFSAWMEKSAELYSRHPKLSGSVTTAMVRALKANTSVAVADGVSGKRYSGPMLLGMAITLARHLQRHHLKRVGVILPPSPEACVAVLAGLLAGATPVMINYTASRSTFESIVRQTGIEWFLSSQAFMQKHAGFCWPEADRIYLVDELVHRRMHRHLLTVSARVSRIVPAEFICKRFRTEERRGDDEAVLLFTSGSSGEPKGVPLTHRMLLANTSQLSVRLSLKEERFLGNLPVFHSFGLTAQLFLPLLNRQPLFTYPNPTDARNLCELVRREKLSFLCATPTFARAMLRRAEADTFATVRYFIVGAEKLQPDLDAEFRERHGIQLLEAYGLTETAPVCSLNLPDAPLIEGCDFYIPGHVPGSIGALLPGVAVRITDVNDDSRELAITQQGMLWFKGSNVFRGYLNRPDLSDSVLHDGWFKSGDIGQLDLNGFIRLGGRLSRFSKIGGEMVPHVVVEEVLTRVLHLDASSGAPQIAVMGVSDERKGEVLVLVSTLPEHQRYSAEKDNLNRLQQAMLAERVPNLWVPRHIVPVEAIPVLGTGKMDLCNCKKLVEETLALRCI